MGILRWQAIEKSPEKFFSRTSDVLYCSKPWRDWSGLSIAPILDRIRRVEATNDANEERRTTIPPEVPLKKNAHVVNTRWLNMKKCSKYADFYAKNQRFLSIFSHLVNACWPHVHRTCNPKLGTCRNLFGPFLPQTVWSYVSDLLRGVEKTIFLCLQLEDGITTFIRSMRNFC